MSFLLPLQDLAELRVQRVHLYNPTSSFHKTGDVGALSTPPVLPNPEAIVGRACEVHFHYALYFFDVLSLAT